MIVPKSRAARKAQPEPRVGQSRNAVLRTVGRWGMQR